MADIIIRNLPDHTKEILRVQAAKSGISLEALARNVLQAAAREGSFLQPDIVELAGECFGSKHGVDLSLPDRSSSREVEIFE